MLNMKDLSSKIDKMWTQFVENVKNLYHDSTNPVKRDDNLRKIEGMKAEMNHFLDGVERYNNSALFESMANQNTPDLSKKVEDVRASLTRLVSQISNKSKQITTIQNELENTNDELRDRVNQQNEQNNDIKNKKELLLSRERMLQLSIEKNIYNRKVIYTYVAIICLVLVLLFTAYYHLK